MVTLGSVTGADRIEIDNLFADYSFAIDQSDWPRFGRVFDETSVWIRANGERHLGLADITAVFETGISGRPLEDLHLVFNIHLEDSTTSDELRSTSNWTYFGRSSRVEAWSVLSMGTYEDIIARTPAGWRFRYRRIHNFDVEDAKTVTRS